MFRVRKRLTGVFGYQETDWKKEQVRERPKKIDERSWIWWKWLKKRTSLRETKEDWWKWLKRRTSSKELFECLRFIVEHIKSVEKTDKDERGWVDDEKKTSVLYFDQLKMFRFTPTVYPLLVVAHLKRSKVTPALYPFWPRATLKDDSSTLRRVLLLAFHPRGSQKQLWVVAKKQSSERIKMEMSLKFNSILISSFFVPLMLLCVLFRMLWNESLDCLFDDSFEEKSVCFSF